MQPGDVFSIVIAALAAFLGLLTGLLALRENRRKPSRNARLRMVLGLVGAGCFVIVLVLNVMRVTA